MCVLGMLLPRRLIMRGKARFVRGKVRRGDFGGRDGC